MQLLFQDIRQYNTLVNRFSMRYLIVALFFSRLVNGLTQCTGSEPVVYLGNDTTLCSGQTIQLQAPGGYDLYQWSDNSTGTTLNVNSAGDYSVSCILLNTGTNLVVNGDFEGGNSGFTSSYSYVGTPSSTALWNPGFYAIGTNPNDYHSNFYNCTDHTSGTGQMYIANGSSTPSTVIWEQTITVAPNTGYNFSAWVSSVENTSVPAILQFFVNGTQIGNVFSPSNTGCEWDEFFDIWNSGTNTSATISIVNQNTESSGNDFALDDITFTSSCINRDTISISYDPITATVTSPPPFCSNSPQEIIGSSNDPNATFSWNTGETTAIITPDISGIYILTATSQNGCTAVDQGTVLIYDSPNADFTANPMSGPAPLMVDFSNYSTNGTQYYWDFGNGETAYTTDLSPTSSDYLIPGNYEVELVATNANCQDSVLLVVEVSLPLVFETTNVFTPNGDGINDEYHFHLKNYSTLEVVIINRWGNYIATINSVDGSWNGKTQDGKEATEGIYFYKYNASSALNESISGHGTINLIR